MDQPAVVIAMFAAEAIAVLIAVPVCISAARTQLQTRRERRELDRRHPEWR